MCKDCGGGGDRHARCEHGRQRRFCKDCCGSGLCKQHLRQRCTECKAAAALAAVAALEGETAAAAVQSIECTVEPC